LNPNGIKILLKRLGVTAGVDNVYAHRWRHNFAHEWKLAGGNTGDLMLLLGWASEDMPRHYGASAAAERAQEIQAQRTCPTTTASSSPPTTWSKNPPIASAGRCTPWMTRR
jgi:integrase